MGETIKKLEDPHSRMAGTFHDGAELQKRLDWATRNMHLVSPFPAAHGMPEGVGVQLAVVRIDPDRETYGVGNGKVGLTKPALDRIAHAVGISWDPSQSRRLDDGRDPHYVHYRVVGSYRGLDGQRQTIVGEKEVDLREGSAQVVTHKTAKQTQEMRAHILSQAETKARLRAIRSMGVRTSYEPAELTKPFACTRVMFTGHSDDPELRRQFSMMTAQAFLGSSHAVYGDPSPQPSHGHLPPPVGSVVDEDADWAPVTPAPVAQEDGVHVMRFGRQKGTAICDADTASLEWYRGAIADAIDDDAKARYRAENEGILSEVESEIARRG